MGFFSRFKKQDIPATEDVDVEALPVNRVRLQEAQRILGEYKAGKAALERRVIENEQWYKLRHWEQMRKKDKGEVEPASAWLFNCIENKHADAMDNYPRANLLPRAEDDKASAEMLTKIVPLVLQQNNYESTYAEAWHDKLIGGTAVYGVYWDSKKLNGLGDIAIEPIDILSIFWEPGIKDIQRSRNVFVVELMDNDVLEEAYPSLKGKLSSKVIDTSKYIYDDAIRTDNKSAVVDWYYKKTVNGKQVLHFCKFVGETVLFATENQMQTPTTLVQDPQSGQMVEVPTGEPMAVRGWYDHGMYPFVIDALFPVKGTPAGIGYVDIGKSVQEYIDRGNQAVLMNMLVNASPRFFVRKDGAVNLDEYADMSNTFIHVDGPLGQDSIVPVPSTGLSGAYLQILQNKVEELKETTGNRDVSTGGTSQGVTAASAIAAMQEAGSKLSRDHIRASYRAFRQVCLQVVELIRQFYDLPRSFRIVGENGAISFEWFDNRDIASNGMRNAIFDIEITAEKQSPYSRLIQNEMALQFYGAGFFNPQMADQSLACLEMMDFDRKNEMMMRIAQNGTLFQQVQMLSQQVMQMAAIIDSMKGTNLSEGAAAGMMQGAQPMPNAQPSERNVSQEAPTTRKARERTANSTNPS